MGKGRADTAAAASVAEEDVETVELKLVNERRQSLKAAKARLQEARIDAALNANVYGKEGAEVEREAGFKAQMLSAREWYQFWESPKRIPALLLLSSGKKLGWAKVASKALKEVKELASAELTEFEGVYRKGGVTFAQSPDLVVKGVPLLRASKEVAVAPRTVLLTQIRAMERGALDPAVLFMRSHYTFRGGKTSLFHFVRQTGGAMTNNRDFFVMQTWEEDEEGVITIAAKSVENCLSKKVVPGTVRGSRLLFGMQISPKTVTKTTFLGFGPSTEIDGCHVSVVSHTLFGGWAPAFMQKSFATAELSNFFASIEATALAMSNVDELVARFIDGGEDNDDDEDRAEDAVEPDAEGDADADADAEADADADAEE